MTKKTMIKNILICATLVAIAVGWRVINHEFTFAPNLEFVTVAAVLAALIIGLRAAVIVPIASIIISDLIIGNTSIFVFTWSAFAIIGLSAVILRKLSSKPGKQIVSSVGFAAASSFFFFIVTNFGVWAQGWYPATFTGLVTCFTVAIPFYRTMLIGNLIIVPVAVGAYQLVKARADARNLIVDSLVG